MLIDEEAPSGVLEELLLYDKLRHANAVPIHVTTIAIVSSFICQVTHHAAPNDIRTSHS